MSLTQEETAKKRHNTGLLDRFLGEKTGVAAIEFAFIAPILVILYLGSMEVGQAVETNKKVGRTSSMVADIVAQQSTVTKDQLQSIMEIGKSVIKPYARSQMTIKVASINIDASNVARETWWRQLNPDGSTSGGGSLQAANPPVPPSLLRPNSSLIRVETSTGYKWVLTYNEEKAAYWGAGSFWQGIPMKETYYLAPRVASSGITCSNC